MKPKVILMSFGFKYGMPNSNYYFDVGFLKNPAREKQWSFFTPASELMREFILKQEKTKEFLSCIIPLIEFLATVDQNQIFAFGCSAGRHRSSIIVEVLAEQLAMKGIQVEVRHRDKDMG